MTYVSESFWHNTVSKATTGLFAFGYRHIIKPNFVSNHRPDEAHDQVVKFCHVVENVPPLLLAEQLMLDHTDPILGTSVMDVDFINPFGLSAGLDKNCEMPVVLNHADFGLGTISSTILCPCPGNTKPWFRHLPEYNLMIVHVGPANIGSDEIVGRTEKAWTQARQMQLSVSIACINDDRYGDLNEGIEDYCISMRRAAGRTAMVEVNVSCPNTHVGKPFAVTPEALDRLSTALNRTSRPQSTLVKMPLNKPWSEYKGLLDVLAEHDVQGLSITSLQEGRTGLEIPRDWEGGLSGDPCTNASTELVREVYKKYGDRLTAVGIGSVLTPEQACTKIRSGSSLIMLISSLMYRGPQQIAVLKRGLVQLLCRDGFEHVSDAVGVDVE